MKIIDAPQRSEGWFAARRGIPSCSRFDQIVTPKTGAPSKSQDKLIAELIAESLEPAAPEGFIRGPLTADMEQGMRLEGEARCAYELEFAKLPVREVGFVLSDCGRFGGSPDALVGDVGGVEIKCPRLSTHIAYIRAGELPDDYKTQVHGYMAVTGREWWDFFSYARLCRPFHLHIERDDFTAKLTAELAAFCSRYNEARALFDLPPIGNLTNLNPA
jgi:hypothetical protein